MFAKFSSEKLIHVKFDYNPPLAEKLKATGVYEWRKTGKYWTLKPTLEAIEFLLSENFKFPEHDYPKIIKALENAEALKNIKKVKFALSKALSAPEIPDLFKQQINFTVAPFQWAAPNYVLLNDRAYFLLADDMGLGKTLQAIITTLLPELAIKNTLVICPAGVTYNWQQELKEKFGFDSIVIDKKFKGPVPGINFYISSFDRAKTTEEFADCIIIDEAHYIKRKTTGRYKAAKRHCLTAKVLMCLTGTPIENRPNEAHTFLTLLDPDCPTWYAFAAKYCGLKREYRYKDGKLMSYLDYSGATDLAELHKYLFETCTIRRTKAQVLTQLPDLTRQVIDLGDHDVDGDSIFTMYKENSELKQKDPAFLEWIEETITSGQKCLIFTHHLNFQLELANLCTKLKLPFITINGSTPPKERQDLVNSFNNDPNIKIALLSITAASAGINMQAASMVIFAELYFVATILMQAEARAHRMGQKNAVTVYLPVISKFEKSVLELLLEKMRIFAITLDGEQDIKDDDTGESSLLKELSRRLGMPIGMEKKK